MKILNKLNKVLLAFIAVILVSGGSLVNADEIASGRYTVKNSVYHDTEIGMSMARSYLDEEMTVTITKEGVVFTIGFSGTEYMNNYRIKINGEEVNAEIVEEDVAAGTIKLQAAASSTAVELSTAIYVDPMGRDVEFGIIPDYSTLVLVEAIEEDEVEVEEISEENDEIEAITEDTEDVSGSGNEEYTSGEEDIEVTEESEDKSVNKLALAGGGILCILIVSGVMVAIKKRK